MSNSNEPASGDNGMRKLYATALELAPLVLFFAANSRWGIYWGTGIFIVATAIALPCYRLLEKRWPIMPLVGGFFVLVFGGLTIWLQDDTFIKLKPTIVIDTYGGTAAPQGIVAAAARMARQGVARVVLVGDVARMQEHLSLLPYDPMTLRLVGAPATYPRQVGDIQAQVRAARLGLPIAMELLRTGEADALLTASPQSLVLELAETHLAKLPGVTAS